MSNKNGNHDQTQYFNFLGLRTIKTVVAVFICLLISYFRNTDPMNSLIAAIIVMKNNPKLGIESGVERLIGTTIGGIYGFFTILIARAFNMNILGIPYYIMIALMLIPVIYTIILAKVPDSVSIGAVVFFSVTVSMALTPDITPLIFVIKRVIETFIGIFVSVIVNMTIGKGYKMEE